MVRLIDIDNCDTPLSELIAQMGVEPIKLVRGSVTVATLSPPARATDESETKPGKSLAQALAEDGLLGKYEGLPTDLSSDPRYLEDFGTK